MPRARRILLRLLRIGLLVYLALILVFSQLQESLLFPGTRTQGTADAALRPSPGTGEKVLEIKSADGTKLAGLFAPARLPGGAADPDAASRPTLLFFYGNGMSAADCGGFALWFPKALAVNVLIPDYPGYGESGGVGVGAILPRRRDRVVRPFASDAGNRPNADHPRRLEPGRRQRGRPRLAPAGGGADDLQRVHERPRHGPRNAAVAADVAGGAARVR